MTHPWQKRRPISAWIPAGMSVEKKVIEHRRKVVVDQAGCSMCGLCWLLCPEGIISHKDHIDIDTDYCRCCGICIEACPKDVMSFVDEELS